jgi:putative endonuclease
MNLTQWYVYILRCADNSLYTGVTTDLERRLNEHNTSNKLGAKYTRVRRPVSIVYSEKHPDRKAACQREYSLKQLKKTAKEALITK